MDPELFTAYVPFSKSELIRLREYIPKDTAPDLDSRLQEAYNELVKAENQGELSYGDRPVD